MGQKRRSDDFLNEKTISDVDICNSSSHEKRKSVNVCLSADSPNSSLEVDYDEDEEVELEVEERSDPSEGSILEEDRILAEKHGFKAEWLESIATRCSPEAATSVISLCHILTERQNKIDRLAKSLTIWGITEPSWLRQDDIIIDNPERRGTPAIYRPGRDPEVRPVVTGSATKLEILPARFSKSQVGAFIQHLRSCAIGKVGDRRLDLISPGACLTIGNAFVAEGIIDEIQSETDEWLQWCGLDLAEKLSRCFETDNPLSSATVDWKVMMLRNCNLQLNIRDRETYLSFVQSINQVVEDAVSKSTPERDVVEALICSIFQGNEGDKNLTGPALAAKTLQSRLCSLAKQTPILNLRESWASALRLARLWKRQTSGRSAGQSAHQWVSSINPSTRILLLHPLAESTAVMDVGQKLSRHVSSAFAVWVIPTETLQVAGKIVNLTERFGYEFLIKPIPSYITGNGWMEPI